MENYQVDLGALKPLYEEYCSIVHEDPEGFVLVPFNEKQIADNVQKINVAAILSDFSSENLVRFLNEVEKAKSKKISVRDLNLGRKGFASGLIGLFVEIDAINPETDSEIISNLQSRIDFISAIPIEHRRGALILGQPDKSYYWGGVIHYI